MRRGADPAGAGRGGLTVDPLPPLTEDSRLVLKELTVVPEDGEHLVGDPQTGVYVAVPRIAVTLIERLRGGATLGQAGQAASVEAGEEVDAVDFGQTLVELGFVAQINGTPVSAMPDAPARRWIAGVRPELVRPLFGPLAWLCYGVLFVGCAVLMVAVPAYRPDPDDLYFLSSPVLSLGALAVWAMLSTAGHEVAHWLAARAQGVPARFSIGRRLYFLVFETDLSQLWGLPRRRRFGPLLAGLAYDTVLLSGLLAVALIGADDGLDRLVAALVAVEVSGILFQFLVFLRTDLYAVLVMLLGCRDLWRVNTLELRRMLGRLDERQAAELASAHPRDRRVAAWFRWLCLAGFAAAAGYFVAFFLPALWTLLGWIAESLSTAAPTTGRFWQSVVFSALALTPLALLVGVATRERLHRRRKAQ
ncbi:MAG TPA: hypothetical protein VGX25_22515 [Actinophytocola sp.]|uniref:hypothetical protein n=1 Tax=Actinophytocola sp. TaxID=1872138 RepID=UPI002DDD9DC6|nr:hypothetical protein [Actinophytocola sp.]HEV2782175.1 hypothetical protein [Actinophytocola sp.]